MDIYDVLKSNRSSGALNTFSVPDAYNGVVPDVTCTLSGATAGTYAIAYNFEVDFNGNKDKALGFTVTGDYAGVEFSESVGASSADTAKSRLYATTVDITSTQDIVMGLQFRDINGGNGFIIDHCDVSITKMANL